MTSPDPATTVLYVLTTLAQSCAALAAFVGAVGVFRIQMLRERRQDAERDLRYWAGQAHVFNSTFVLRVPIKEIIKCLDADREKPTTAYRPDQVPNAYAALDAWRESAAPFKWTSRALLVLEGWNLAVIAAALICFNRVPALAVAPWSPRTLVFVAVVTAAIPLWCVFVWTRGVDK